MSGPAGQASGAVLDGAANDVARLAPAADTPAGQRTLIAALRNRVAQQQGIVQEHTDRGRELAASVRTLNYETGAPGDQASVPPRRAGIQTVGFGIAPPLAPPDPQLPEPPPGLEQPRNGSIPEPIRDFTNYQLRDKAAPPYVPPVTGEPIRRPPTPPQPMPVINLNLDPGNRDLFTRCDGGDVAKAWAEIIGGGLAAVGAVATGPVTGGLTLVGLGGAATAIGIGEDDLYNCK
jgi:hypothetical protein